MFFGQYLNINNVAIFGMNNGVSSIKYELRGPDLIFTGMLI